MDPANNLTIQSLSSDWRDKDSVLLHACFQLLKDCVEEECLLDCHIDWDSDDRHRKAKKEIQELYDWWMTYQEAEGLDQVQYETENEMLHRLIDVRWALWT